jgi:hypothetical protein
VQPIASKSYAEHPSETVSFVRSALLLAEDVPGAAESPLFGRVRAEIPELFAEGASKIADFVPRVEKAGADCFGGCGNLQWASVKKEVRLHDILSRE